MPQARVVQAHQRTYNDPIRVRAGDKVIREHRDEEYPGWCWGVSADGKEGWVPEAWLDRLGFVREDYDALELNVTPGDSLIVERTESGWALARSGSGERGWVPLHCLEMQAG